MRAGCEQGDAPDHIKCTGQLIIFQRYFLGSIAAIIGIAFGVADGFILVAQCTIQIGFGSALGGFDAFDTGLRDNDVRHDADFLDRFARRRVRSEGV